MFLSQIIFLSLDQKRDVFQKPWTTDECSNKEWPIPP